MRQKIATYRFEDLKIGMNVSIKMNITKEKIEEFSNLTGDFHPLHCNLDYCIDNGFDTILAQGMLISSFSSRIAGMMLPGENALILSQSFSYYKPIYMGETITMKGSIEKIDKRFKVIEVAITVENEKYKASSGIVKVKVRH